MKGMKAKLYERPRGGRPGALCATTKESEMAFNLELKLDNSRRACCERTDRYAVILNGARAGEVFFNMRGFIGYLPTPSGAKLDIGERPIGAFRRAVAQLNREARA
jgi:hypothetical protein